METGPAQWERKTEDGERSMTLRDRRGRSEIASREGTCQLCGGHGRELRILAQDDFIGWACEECIRELRECQVRRYCSAQEETEPNE